MVSCCYLYLVRHGLTRWNLEKRYLGHTDLSLAREHGHKLERLKQEFNQLSFDLVFSSDLTRCRETLEVIIPTYPTDRVIFDSRLRELNFGDWEGQIYEDLKEQKDYQNWLMDWENYSPPSGERGDEFKKRVHHFMEEAISNKLERISQQTKTRILMMSHGGVIRELLLYWQVVSSFWEPSIQHGEGFCLKLIKNERGEWICSLWSVVPTPEREE